MTDTKTCPSCAQPIQAAAKVCPYCQRQLTGVGGTSWQRWAVIIIVTLFAGWWLVAALAGSAK